MRQPRQQQPQTLQMLPLLLLLAAGLPAAGSTQPCSVLDYGAVGDGVTLDTHAVNAALGDTGGRCAAGVLFPASHTFLCGSLHLRSHLLILVEVGAVILGAANNISAYDPPEPNPYDQYQASTSA